MLKKVLVNGKKIPVPVPVRTLGEALVWLDSTLVPPGHTVTRVILEGEVVAVHGDVSAQLDTLLGDSAKLEVQIDSPVELTAQTLDAMRNLASAISSGLKALAVACWQAKGTGKPNELDTITGDLELIRELLDHVSGLLDSSYPEISAIQGIAGLLGRVVVQVTMARVNSDWKACARLLLNRLEPLLQELSGQTESLQQRLLAQLNPGVAKVGGVQK